MEKKELIELIVQHKDRLEKNYYSYVKVLLTDGNLTIDLKEDGNTIYLSSNDFLTINNVCFYHLNFIWDIEFY